jgi:hypothetical protein
LYVFTRKHSGNLAVNIISCIPRSWPNKVERLLKAAQADRVLELETMHEAYTFACGRFYLAVIELTWDGDRKDKLHGAALDHLYQIKPESHLPSDLRARYLDLFDQISTRESVDRMTEDEVREASREIVNLFGALCEYEIPGPK